MYSHGVLEVVQSLGWVPILCHCISFHPRVWAVNTNEWIVGPIERFKGPISSRWGIPVSSTVLICEVFFFNSPSTANIEWLPKFFKMFIFVFQWQVGSSVACHWFAGWTIKWIGSFCWGVIWLCEIIFLRFEDYELKSFLLFSSELNFAIL